MACAACGARSVENSARLLVPFSRCVVLQFHLLLRGRPLPSTFALVLVLHRGAGCTGRHEWDDPAVLSLSWEAGRYPGTSPAASLDQTATQRLLNQRAGAIPGRLSHRRAVPGRRSCTISMRCRRLASTCPFRRPWATHKTCGTFTAPVVDMGMEYVGCWCCGWVWIPCHHCVCRLILLEAMAVA